MTTKGAAGRRTRKPAAPDVVYVVRPGDDNEELRYSLRSVAANSPHRNVWIVGSIPSWVRGVKALPLVPQPEKFANQRQSLHAIAAHPDISDPFVLFNDDMFVMEPIAEWRTWNLDTIEEQFGGPIGAVTTDNPWMVAVWHTYKWMGEQGHPNPLYYENHTPLLYDKVKLADVLSRYPVDRPFVVNGTYALCGAGGEGEWGANAKLAYEGARSLIASLSLGMPYLSTEDESFRLEVLGEHIRATFPEPGPYEEAS